MAVTFPAAAFEPFDRFSLYNSPYAAHDRGCAIDLYPPRGTNCAPSPVAGEVLDAKRVRAPSKPYAPEHDYVLVIDAGDRLARVLHVDPAVRPGERVAIGDPLGELVRAGFFAPWVDEHVHLGFRDPGSDPYRASGSLRIEPAVDVRPLAWDGAGTVVERGETYAVLDAPRHPAPGEYFVGVGIDDGTAVLDGGLPHYDCGGLLAARDGVAQRDAAGRPITILSRQIGLADGRHVAWTDPTVYANGEPITGLSLFAARDGDFGAKLICPDASFAVGEEVRVSIGPRS